MKYVFIMQNNQFQSLNETGTEIWRLIVNNHNDVQIVDSILHLYQAHSDKEAQQIREDIAVYLDELLAGGLIIRV